jgi:hypothetical protein
MSGVAGRSGRKKFVPTPDHRDLVTLLATRGIPQEYIRRLIRNPQTGRPVSIKTLERAFATEIKTAKVEFACQIARFVMDSILGRRSVNAKPIKNERLRATLAIFVAKTRLGWTMPNRHHRVRGPTDAQESRRRLDAKIARLAPGFKGWRDWRSRAERDTIINFASQSATRPISSCADQATLPPPDRGVQIAAHGAPTRGHVGPRKVDVLGALFACDPRRSMASIAGSWCVRRRCPSAGRNPRYRQTL